MPALTPDDLQAYLLRHNIPGEIIHLTAQTPTVAAAAAALGVTPEQIVKTVLFMVNGVPCAVLANGTRRVDSGKLAVRFNVARGRVKLADAETVLRYIGYAPGTVPPIGHLTPVQTLMERSVRDQEIIYAGGGGLHAMLRIASADLIAAVQPELLDVLENVVENDRS